MSFGKSTFKMRFISRQISIGDEKNAFCKSLTKEPTTVGFSSKLMAVTMKALKNWKVTRLSRTMPTPGDTS